MADDPHSVVLGWIDAVIVRGEVDRWDEFISPDFVNGTPPPSEEPHSESYRSGFEGFALAFTDVSVDVRVSLVSDDLWAGYTVVAGTHVGGFAGLAPTGNSFSAGAAMVFRVVDGRIVERWEQFDSNGLMDQLRKKK